MQQKKKKHAQEKHVHLRQEATQKNTVGPKHVHSSKLS